MSAAGITAQALAAKSLAAAPLRIKDEMGLSGSSGLPVLHSAGCTEPGTGMGRFVRDAIVDAAFVAAHPHAAFMDSAGVGYRLDTEDRLSILHFGAKPANHPRSAIDCTAAFEAAQAFLRALEPERNSKRGVIHVPDGWYGIDGFLWDGHCSFIGASLENTRLVYPARATPQAGSFMIAIPDVVSGALPFAGFAEMRLSGWAGGPQDPIAEHCIYNLGYGIDLGFLLRRMQFSECYGDAVVLHGQTDGEGIINCFLEDLRFDKVGGYALVIGQNQYGSGHPFTWRKGTWDNSTNANLVAAATAQGVMPSDGWGKGVLHIVNGRGLNVVLSDMRWETGNDLVAHTPSTGVAAHALVMSDNVEANGGSISLSNISGSCQRNQHIDLVHDANGKLNYEQTSNVGVNGAANNFRDATDHTRNIAKWTNGFTVSRYAATQSVGQNDAGYAHGGFLSLSPDRVSGHGAYYRKGSVVWNRNPQDPGRPTGWICMYPAAGLAPTQSGNITTNASCTAGSPTINVPANVLNKLGVGHAIILAGAGPAGSDLHTRVTGYIPADRSLQIANNPATSVGQLTIRHDAAQFMPLGYVPGRQVRTGSATVTLGSDDPVQECRNAVTSDRTMTLVVSDNICGNYTGRHGKFRFLRGDNATGTSVIRVEAGGATLASLAAPGDWVDVELFDGQWRVSAGGAIPQ